MRKIILLFISFISSLVIYSQQQNRWVPVNESDINKNLFADRARPANFKLFRLQQTLLKADLNNVPMELNVRVNSSDFILTVPGAEGQLEKFRLVEAPVMHQELSERFPGIKSFAGVGVEDPAALIRFAFSELGFNGTIFYMDRPTVFIERIDKETDTYIIVSRNNISLPAYSCGTKAGNEFNGLQSGLPGPDLANADDGTLRTYRLAMAATGEYSQSWLDGTEGSDAARRAKVLAAMNNHMTRVNGIMERDFSLRMILIANNDLIIYLDPATDPWVAEFNAQTQTTIDAVIGNANYDIGHLVKMGGNNGNAGSVGNVCIGGAKGSAFTSRSDWTSGIYFEEYILTHEMGHQYDANHTFTHADDNDNAQMEPGSGNTIMSYAGITGPATDIQPLMDDYFHGISIEQATNWIKTHACHVTLIAGLNTPSANAGANYMIPKSTPFKLTGSGSDPDEADVLTYNWEQVDKLTAPGDFPWLPNTTHTYGPEFKSVLPSSSTSRTFPVLANILDGTNTNKWEKLPSVGRTLNFRFTVRDNHPGAGQNKSDEMVVTVDGTKGPFGVTSPNTSVSWCPGPQTVTWSVNESDALAANVKILLSTDGGNSFPVTLAASTPNDGSQLVTIPCTYSTAARIKIEAIGNIFFDISNANFTTGDNTKPTFTVPANITINKDANCNYNASPAITGDVTDEADNCDNSLNATFADGTAPGSCVGKIILTRTWTLTDDCGNSTVKIQTITITDNTAPTFTKPPNITIYKDANCNYNASPAITGDVTDEDDNCDNTLNATYSDANAPGSCDGETIITRTWTLTDDCGNATVKVQTITVKDNIPPTFTEPADITIYKDNNCNHNASVSVTGDVTDEDDNCDNTLNAVFSDVTVPGSCIGEEIITRTWTLTDDCGNNAIPQNQIITVKDTTRPVISGVSANPSVLWPPNHKMVLVTINYSVEDNCSPVNAITNYLTAVSNEPENGLGDGDTGPDMIVVDPHHVWLRAERAGNGNGRIYTVTIHSTDDCGNKATTTVNVYVPHNKNMPITAKSNPGATENSNMNTGMTVKAMPNPSSSFFSLKVSSENDRESITVMIYDLYGRKLDQFTLSNGSTVMIGEKYRSGVYMVRVQQGATHKEMKLIKISE